MEHNFPERENELRNISGPRTTKATQSLYDQQCRSEGGAGGAMAPGRKPWSL